MRNTRQFLRSPEKYKEQLEALGEQTPPPKSKGHSHPVHRQSPLKTPGSGWWPRSPHKFYYLCWCKSIHTLLSNFLHSQINQQYWEQNLLAQEWNTILKNWPNRITANSHTASFKVSKRSTTINTQSISGALLNLLRDLNIEYFVNILVFKKYQRDSYTKFSLISLTVTD